MSLKLQGCARGMACKQPHRSVLFPGIHFKGSIQGSLFACARLRQHCVYAHSKGLAQALRLTVREIQLLDADCHSLLLHLLLRRQWQYKWTWSAA